ncbi:MAG TPA: hypothetical protein VGR82_17585 [Methylomirabilota bacterium]|jgi:hypothetical protein|nr:hypothetical protein [Methylomirabilota bacterium]
MAKTQILEYTIHLRDRALAEQLAADLASLTPTTLTGAVLVYPGGGKIGILRAPEGAAIEFAIDAAAYPPALPILEVGDPVPTTGAGYITSPWLTTSNTFPRDVATFTRSSGWWIFGSNTKFYWVAQVAYSPLPESLPPSGVVEETEPALIPQRVALTGWDLSNAGDPLEGLASAANSLLISRGGASGIDGYAGSTGATGTGTQYTAYALSTLAQRGHWERFYFTVVGAAPSDAVGLWRGFNFSTNGTGFSIEVLPSLQIAFRNWSALAVNTLQGTFATLVVGQRYLVDVVFDVDGTNDLITCSVYLNHTLLCAGSRAAGGVLGNRYHSESRIGKEQAVATSGTLAFDNYIIAKIPSTKDPAVPTWSSITAYVTGDVVKTAAGVRYKALQNGTNHVPGLEPLFWRRLTDPIDWIHGSRLVRLKANAFASSHSGNWTGDFRVLMQRPDGIAFAGITSSTSGALAAVTTDVPRQVEALPGAIGWVGLQVNAYTKRAGVVNGALGYKIGAGAPVDTTIVETGTLAWKGVIYAPAALTAPIPAGTGVELRFTKAADATLATLAVLVGTVEVIGTFGEEDVFPNEDPEADADPVPPQPVGGVHSAWVPYTPWAMQALPIGPVIIVGGTYAGNSLGQDITFKAPPILLLIRPLTGSAGGPLVWSSLLGSHISHNQGISFEIGIADVDQDLTYTQADPNADQQMQFRVRLGGAGAQYNVTGTTYQYIAFCDPAARYSRAGVALGTSLNAPQTHLLDDVDFLAEFALVWRENYDTTTTDAVHWKGAAHAADAMSLISGATTIAASITFGTGLLTLASAFFNSVTNYPFLLFRTNDGNSYADQAKVWFKGTYTGDGSGSRTITIGATGLRPMWAIVGGVGSGNVRHRDPSHTGTNSENPSSGANDATLGLTAGGVDAFTVGTALNANGVVYQYFGFYGSATAGNNGWSINTELVPVPADSRKPAGWTEPTTIDPDVEEPAEPNPLDPGDLTTDIAADCVASSTRLCNLALSEAGITVQLADLSTDTSQEAFTCRLVYKTIVDAVLRAYAWNFARTYSASAGLTLVAGTADAPVNPDWTYSYALPADCLRVLRVLDVTGGRARQSSFTPIAFQVLQDDTPRDLLYTNEPAEFLQAADPVRVEYLRRVPCPGRVTDAVFRQCLIYRLAAAIAKPLGKDQKDADALLAKYRDLLPQDKVLHANEQERQRPTDTEPDWITGR